MESEGFGWGKTPGNDFFKPISDFVSVARSAFFYYNQYSNLTEKARWRRIVLEKELEQIQRVIGQIKEELLTNTFQPELEDEVSYKLATKIDLTVSRFMRLLECR